MITARSRATMIAGGLLLPALMTAQLDRSRVPVPGPAPVVNMGAHTTFLLPNNMRVIVVENHKLPMVGVQVRFDIPPMIQGGRAGYIDLVGDLLAAGTPTRDKATIDESVDRMGASLFTSNDGLYANALKKHLDGLMDIVADVITQPTFPEVELEKARKRAMSEVQQRQEDPGAIADAVGRAVTFGNFHPYGEVTTEKTLRLVDRAVLIGYHRKFFRPEKGYLVFVGDITEKEAKALAKEHFGKWKPKQVSHVVNDDGTETIEGIGIVQPWKHVATPAGPRRVVIVDRPGAAQSIVRVGFPLNFQPKDLRALNAQVMNTILGGGVFNARLMQNLREDKGWTYGTGSDLQADRFNGSFHTTANVRTAVTDSAVVETLNELLRMRDEPVTTEELELAKRYMAGSFARSLEDPRTVARFALNTYLNGLPEDHYATYLKRLEAVSIADVQAAAETFLYPDNAVIFVVGDRASILPKLEPLSQISDPAVIELDHNGKPYEEELERVKDRTAEQIIEHYLEAIGGRSAIATIRDMRTEITTELGGEATTLTQWYGPNNQYRSLMKVKGNSVQEEVLDGMRAVRKVPAQPDEELFDIDLLDLKQNAYPVPEVFIKDNVERLILSGSTMIGDRKTYKITMMTNAGTSLNDYYDAETGLKLRRVDLKYMYGRNLKIITDYSDYQPAGGVLFPRSLVQSGGPVGSMTMQVTAIEVNKPQAVGFFNTGLPAVVDE
ncbi:MAG: insulinase family protein [Flavobacteriales bacterium]|nr:insulinase family protein [Flavobacteriales bacterium]